MSNPLWPLPRNYPELSPEQQAKARRVGMAMWRRYPKGERQSLGLVRGVEILDKEYLMPDHEGGFDPQFYMGGLVVKPPKWHQQATWLVGSHRQLAVRAPRGWAKSAWLSKLILLVMLTWPGVYLVFMGSTLKRYQRVSTALRKQLYQNEKLRRDFGVLKPGKVEASTGVGMFSLTNGATIEFGARGAAIRGIRPMFILLDDVERDEEDSRDMELITDRTDLWLKQVILPAMTAPGSTTVMAGTLISARHYLPQLFETKLVQRDGEWVEESLDPAFKKWKKLAVNATKKIVVVNGKQERLSTWPEWIPGGEWEREQMGLSKDYSTLDEKREEMRGRDGSDGAYYAEFEGKVTEAGGRHFEPYEKERNGWEFASLDGKEVDHPTVSASKVRWWQKTAEGNWAVKEALLRDLLAAGVYLVGDCSYTSGPMSDWKTWMVWSKSADGMLFVWDAWAYQGELGEQVRVGLELADQWRAVRIAPERNGPGLQLENEMNDQVLSRPYDAFMPVVKGFTVPMAVNKQNRVAAMKPAWVYGKIKLPDHRMGETGGFFALLRAQMLGFTPHAKDGGLSKDDAIDTLSMPKHVMPGSGITIDSQIVGEDMSWEKMLEEGQLVHPVNGMPTGLELIQRFGYSKVLEAMREKEERDKQGGVTEGQWVRL